MSRLNPFSAFYYIKENKNRALLCVFMMLLASMMFLAGNFIHSELYTFEKEFSYSEKLVVAGIQSTDDEYKDWEIFKQKVMEDHKLNYVDVTAYGFSGLQHGTVLNIEMGGCSYVFNSKKDMEKVFNFLGIEGDFSNCKNNSMIISKDLATNKGISLGDTVDHSLDSRIDGSYTVDAIIDDGSYCTFYIYEDEENLGRLYIFSDSLEGQELYTYVKNIANGLKVQVSESERNSVLPQFMVFYVLFYIIDILVAVVLAVTVNSVVTGYYLKRTFEFGIYRAIGISKKEIRRKVAAEILAMDLIACTIGFGFVIFCTYMLNELLYKEQGLHLLYYSKTGMVGFIICDALIVIPLILSKGAMMSKANVTDF